MPAFPGQEPNASRELRPHRTRTRNCRVIQDCVVGHLEYLSSRADFLRVKGYRIGFYSSDQMNRFTSISMNPGTKQSSGSGPCNSVGISFRDVELREIARILEMHEHELMKAWNAAE